MPLMTIFTCCCCIKPNMVTKNDEKQDAICDEKTNVPAATTSPTPLTATQAKVVVEAPNTDQERAASSPTVLVQNSKSPDEPANLVTIKLDDDDDDYDFDDKRKFVSSSSDDDADDSMVQHKIIWSQPSNDDEEEENTSTQGSQKEIDKFLLELNNVNESLNGDNTTSTLSSPVIEKKQHSTDDSLDKEWQDLYNSESENDVNKKSPAQKLIKTIPFINIVNQPSLISQKPTEASMTSLRNETKSDFWWSPPKTNNILSTCFEEKEERKRSPSLKRKKFSGYDDYDCNEEESYDSMTDDDYNELDDYYLTLASKLSNHKKSKNKSRSCGGGYSNFKDFSSSSKITYEKKADHYASNADYYYDEHGMNNYYFNSWTYSSYCSSTNYYQSTWDAEDWDSAKNKNKTAAERFPYLHKECRDTIEYRQNMTETSSNDKDKCDNVLFFTGQIASTPRGDFLTNIHKKWRGNYDLLEDHHGYIQWLFPNRTRGMNWESQSLQVHELETLRQDPKAKKLLVKSLDLMLDFYGMTMDDEDADEIIISRSKNYKERYSNLKKYSHNSLRITRIFKCLGDFELEEYQLALLDFLAKEIFVEKELKPLASSYTRYWVHTIKDDAKRAAAVKKVEDLIDSTLATE